MRTTTFVPGAHSWTREGDCLYCDQPILARGVCSRHYNQWWRHGQVQIEPPPVTGSWLCETSDLDFMARSGSLGFPAPITGQWTVKHQAEFTSQLALCLRCTTRDECADLGKDEPYGIWGGTLPHERMT